MFIADRFIREQQARLDAHFRQFEGDIGWMYLDTKGLVTVGIGQQLATEDDARERASRFRVIGEPVGGTTHPREAAFYYGSGHLSGLRRDATPDEVAQVWRTLHAKGPDQASRPKDHKWGAPAYQPDNNLLRASGGAAYLLLPSKERVDMFHARLAETLDDLANMFDAFEMYPTSVKIALADIHYNHGPGGFRALTSLTKAIVAQRWREAADASMRRSAESKRMMVDHQLLKGGERAP